MLKTTKEFDFVYKNSYKFRTETLDICVLKPNLMAQFYAKFRRIPSDFVGFSVSKKVGIAVERNLIKRRFRAICREFFNIGNSSLARPSRELEKFSFDRQPALSQSNFSAQPTNLTQDTRIANDLRDSNNPSLRDSQRESKQSAGFVSEAKQPSKHSPSQTPPASGWVSFDSPSLAEGVRGWVESTQKSTINYELLAKGIFIFSIGLFKKVFIADSFAKWANAGFSVVEKGGYLNIAESWATSLS